MKSVITKSFAYGWLRGETMYFNPVTRKTVTKKNPIPKVSANEVERAKRETISILKQWLQKAGWIYDPSLFKWQLVTESNYGKILYCTIKWIDVNNDGKERFMRYIANTGILDKETVIIKKYS